MSRTAILASLNSGVMKEQAAALSSVERRAVSNWLGQEQASAITTSELPKQCQPSEPLLASAEGPSWTSWGAGLTNWRFQKASSAGFTSTDLSRLKLKWTFGFPAVTQVRSQPAVFGGRVFIGGQDIYSLDTATGCIHWASHVGGPVRSGMVVAVPGGVPMLFFGDADGQVYGLDASTGRPIWRLRADSHPAALVTGTPVYDAGRLYVPVSSFEEASILSPGYVCCSFRGSVLAVDAVSGKVLWKTYTISEAPKPGKPTQRGAKTIGPSGVGIWSAPTIDAQKGILYVTTGDNYSDPPTSTSDAVLALSIKDGRLLWSKQLTEGDAFNISCLQPDKLNCPDSKGPDFDFGASAILAELPGGHRILVLSQKSGALYGVDPDEQGRILWEARVGQGGTLGGIQWGPSTDGERVYVALSDLVVTRSFRAGSSDFIRQLDPFRGGGLFAFRLDSGARQWMTQAPGCGERRPCSPAQAAAISGIPGAVFSGSLDGHLRAYSTSDGKIIWDYDTVREYQTVNGVPAKGGAIDMGGPVIAGGMLFAGSGYDLWGGLPGNVLLAFSLDGR